MKTFINISSRFFDVIQSTFQHQTYNIFCQISGRLWKDFLLAWLHSKQMQSLIAKQWTGPLERRSNAFSIILTLDIIDKDIDMMIDFLLDLISKTRKKRKFKSNKIVNRVYNFTILCNLKQF